TTGSFTLTNNSHTVSFVGLNPNGGDNTAFIDAVTLQFAPPTRLADGGFEAPVSPFDPPSGDGDSSVWYRPSGSVWTFTTDSGVSANNSSFTGSVSAPQGKQVAFLQKQGTISQVINLTAGTYAVSFQAAQRAGQSQKFQVEIDGTVVGTFTPAGSNYNTYRTDGFTVAAGSPTPRFFGLLPADHTPLIAAVHVELALPTLLAGGGFETPASPFTQSGASNSLFWTNPPMSDGSAWTFTAGGPSPFTASGLAANGSAYNNVTAPEGSQVAFLQGKS